jgi:hypothetical protein
MRFRQGLPGAGRKAINSEEVYAFPCKIFRNRSEVRSLPNSLTLILVSVLNLLFYKKVLRMIIGTVEILPWTKIDYNNTPHSERMVEIPLLLWFKNNFKDFVEIGAVSPYYTSVKHPVYDPFDPYEGSIREPAEDLNYTGKNVLSISTIEHIGRGDYNQEKESGKALKVLEKIVQESESYLITWAANQNEELDEYAEKHCYAPGNFFKILRTGYYQWQVVFNPCTSEYGSPYPFGNAVYLVTNCKQFCTWNDLTIVSAFYGTADVRSVLNNYIDSEGLHLMVNNLSMQIDPAPMEQKTLSIKYLCKGAYKELVVDEGSLLSI